MMKDKQKFFRLAITTTLSVLFSVLIVFVVVDAQQPSFLRQSSLQVAGTGVITGETAVNAGNTGGVGLRVLGGGSVGIGEKFRDTSVVPRGALEVDGGAQFTGNLNIIGNGNVGIGEKFRNQEPTSKLDVDGGAQFTGNINIRGGGFSISRLENITSPFCGGGQIDYGCYDYNNPGECNRDRYCTWGSLIEADASPESITDSCRPDYQNIDYNSCSEINNSTECDNFGYGCYWEDGGEPTLVEKFRVNPDGTLGNFRITERLISVDDPQRSYDLIDASNSFCSVNGPSCFLRIENGIWKVSKVSYGSCPVFCFSF
jgi:hypothetical protein